MRSRTYMRSREPRRRAGVASVLKQGSRRVGHGALVTLGIFTACLLWSTRPLCSGAELGLGRPWRVKASPASGPPPPSHSLPFTPSSPNVPPLFTTTTTTPVFRFIPINTPFSKLSSCLGAFSFDRWGGCKQAGLFTARVRGRVRRSPACSRTLREQCSVRVQFAFVREDRRQALVFVNRACSRTVRVRVCLQMAPHEHLCS